MLVQAKVSNYVTIDAGPQGAGLQVVRAVADTVQHCNLRCLYCHPGQVWRKGQVRVAELTALFAAAEEYGVLELILTGGEITLHPHLDALLEATHLLKRTSTTLITNATKITDVMVEQLARSNITRICVSLDGVGNDTHGSARGKNFHRVMDGLRALQSTGREITVISVAHQGNFHRLTELSYMLAETGLASQHHLCAPSYSGEARQHYDQLKLRYDDYFALQRQVDAAYQDLKPRGFWLGFNSFWPATGRRSRVDGGRTFTLQHLAEQTKDSYIIVRSNGAFRLTTASWGRETVGNAAIGNIYRDEPRNLLLLADHLYRSGKLKQLPREVEALHKFQVGPGADTVQTNALIGNNDDPETLVAMVPIKPLSEFSLLQNRLDYDELAPAAEAVRSGSTTYRFIRHASGIYLVFNRLRSHVTLLTKEEWATFLQMYGLTAREAA